VTAFYGATAILGGAELSYFFGLGALWFMVPFYAGNILVLLFLRKIEASKAETLPDFLGEFYGSRVVVASALLLTLLCLVPESIIAAGKIMHYLYPLSPEFWMIVVAAVVVVCTLLGGLRGIAYSDVLQFLLMVSALTIALPYAVNYSPDFISRTSPENLSPVSYLRSFPQDAIRWTIILILMPITAAPLYQRFFASMPKVSRKKAIVCSVFAYFVIDMIVLCSGMIAAVNSEELGLDESNADIALMVLGFKVLPQPLRVLLVLGLIAAVMSTADAWTHSGASSLSYDILRRMGNFSEKTLILASRFFVFVLGVLSLILALYFQDIITALVFLTTVWTAGILLPTVAALTGRKLSEKAALASIFFGGASSIMWSLKPLYAIDPLFVGLFFSFAAAAIARKSGN
jgi:SSS family solute:Na+ symporter